MKGAKMIILALLLLGSTVTEQLPCGFTAIPQSRVIGGRDAKPGAWPWQVALYRYGNFWCGGSLIGSDWILTTAYCVSGTLNPADYKIVVGDHNRNINEGTEETVGAKQIIYHPQYNPSVINYNIALIQLASSVKLSQRVNPICLPAQDSDVPLGSKCYITGWGMIKPPASLPGYHPILQQAMMPPIDQGKCKDKINAAAAPNPLTPQMLCAGVENTILSSCHGDIGGPYACLNSDMKTYTLQGIISWGPGSCNASEYYTVSTRVTKFRAWIKQHTGIGGGGGSPPPQSTTPMPTTPGGSSSTPPPATTKPAVPTSTGSHGCRTSSPPTPPPPTTHVGPPGSCGIRPLSRIVGGVNAKHGDWPWQVQLRTTYGSPYCGGSLVSDQWVVTATHCVLNESPSSIVIRLGAHRRVNTVGSEQDIVVSKVITHPLYHQPTKYSHDIALLKLEKPAQLNRFVNLVCLPQAVAEPCDGTKCWITGWGRLASDGAVPDYLQQVQVPVVSRARCDQAYPGKIHDSMVCAGLDQGGIDSCQGDSGGPMVCETGGKFYLHGVTSWGYGCASPGKFGVYAKTKYLVAWLNSEMSKN